MRRKDTRISDIFLASGGQPPTPATVPEVRGDPEVESRGEGEFTTSLFLVRRSEKKSMRSRMRLQLDTLAFDPRDFINTEFARIVDTSNLDVVRPFLDDD